MDLVITGGTIYNGSGDEPVVGDVGIKDGRIAAVGEVAPGGAEVVDAAGLCVAPGFIDPHTHSDGLLAEPGGPRDAANHLRQGVTTIVTGNCGFGAVDPGAYFADLDRTGVGVNVMHQLPQGSIREAVCGKTTDLPTAGQIDEMKSRLRAGMEAGAVGMSTGLIYVPGTITPVEELIEMATVVAEFDGLYASHIRSESEKLLEAIDEAIHIGAASGCRTHISHIKTAGSVAKGLAGEVCQRIETARAAGRQVTADQYPYFASSTDFATNVIPRWARPTLQSRLSEDKFEPTLLAEMAADLAADGRAGRIMIARFEQKPKYEGMTVAKIAAEMHLSATQTCIEILRLGNPSAIVFGINEEDAFVFAAKDYVATGSDGSFSRREGGIHPRSYGTFARKIADFARDRKLLSVARAVRSSTGLPADILHLTDRGVLREGAVADLVVFDLETLADNATYTNGHQYATGFARVYLAGKAAVIDDEYTGSLDGRSLRPSAKA